MAGAVELPSASGKRSMNADVNLVPFIDLLSVCICFLLMTAVWIQLGMMEVQQTQGTSASAAKDSHELDLVFTGRHQAKLVLKRKGQALQTLQVKAEEEKEFLGKIAEAVTSVVAKAKDPIGSAVITPRTDVNYGEMIQVMDLLRAQKIVNLGVVPVGKGAQ